MPLPLPDDRKNKRLPVAQTWSNTDGFGNLTVDDSDGNITVPQSAALKTGPGGAVSLSAANLFVLGSITAPGGSLTLNAFDISPDGFCRPPARRANSCRRPHARRLHAGVNRASGYIRERHGPSQCDALVAPGASYLPAGGKIAISSFSMDLQRGSVIAADGGLTVNGSGQITYGAGGSISLAAGQDINIPAVFGGVFSGRLNLGATLSGLSGAKGGSLSILAPFIQVGGQSSQTSTLLALSRLFQ